MSVFAKFKRLLPQKNNAKSIININDILPLPSRDMFKDNPKITTLIDYYQNHFFDILSTKKTLVSKNLSVDELYDELEMNADILLQIYKKITDNETPSYLPQNEKEVSEVINMVWFTKMEVYLMKLKDLEEDIIARLVALRELLEIRIFKRNKLAILEEINRLNVCRLTIERKINAIKTDVENHLNIYSVTLSQEKDSFQKRENIKKYIYERLLKSLKTINPQKALEISNISKNIIVKIALLERELDIYCYQNEEEVNSLNQELDKLSKEDFSPQNKEMLLEKIEKIEQKYLIFYDYGTTVNKEDILNLYRLKFKILAIDIFNSEYKFARVYDNDIERSCYYQIIMEKLNDILLGNNLNVGRLFGIDTNKAIKLISEYLKSINGKFNPETILYTDNFLKLLVAFDTQNGFKELLKSLYGETENNLYLSLLLPSRLNTSSPFEWQDSLPLETYCFIKSMNKTRHERVPVDAIFRRYWALFDLYDLMKKNEISNKYFLPEGLTTIDLDSDSYRNRNKNIFDREEKINEFLYRLSQDASGKKVILPSSLVRISGDIFSGKPIAGIELNDGLEYIGDGTLKGYKLKSLVIPASLERINFEDIQDSIEILVFKDYKASKILNDDERLCKLFECFIDVYYDITSELEKNKYEVTNFIRGLKKIVLLDENGDVFAEIKTADLKIKNVYFVEKVCIRLFDITSEAKKIVKRFKEIMEFGLTLEKKMEIEEKSL